MANPEKVAAVAELTNRFSNSAGAVLTEYRGLSVKALKELRRSLGDDATYAVSKNTLTTIAAREAEIEGVEEHLVGPTAIAFIEGDPVAVAKGLRDFARANPFLVIKGGVLDGKALTAEDVRKLADLESREVLLAKVAGGMMGVLQQAIGLVSAPLSQTARLLAALQQAAENDPALLAAGSGEPTNEELAAAEDTSEPTNEELAEATASTDSTGSTDSSTEISSDSTDSSTEISTEISTDSTTETDTTTTDAASAAEDN